jgi:hypothetical protein
VVALLPKPTGNYPYKTNFIDMVSVGIEGTFIQQVNTVSVSPTGLSFKPEFISPQSYTTVLGSDVNLVALQTASPAQPITLSNQSSSAASITKIKFTASSGGADSNDFQVALDQPNKCETQAIDPSKSFSIPAQQTCQIYIRSTPQTVGNTTATMSVEGANIDTTQTVALTGSGVGFYLDTAANSKSRAPFNCSLIAGKCIIDLGSNNGASTIIPAYVFVGSTGDLCPQITQTAANGAISPQPFTCSALPPIKDKAAFQLNLTLDSNSSSIPLTFKIGDASESITFNYQTLATTTTFTSPPTISHTDTKTPLKVVVQVKGTDQPPSLPPVNSTVKLLIQLGATITPQEATTVQDGTATFSVPLTTVGTYHLSATFEDSGKFAESSTTTQLTVTVTDPTTAAPAQPAPR